MNPAAQDFAQRKAQRNLLSARIGLGWHGGNVSVRTALNARPGARRSRRRP